jgi:hypothetical protein
VAQRLLRKWSWRVSHHPPGESTHIGSGRRRAQSSADVD